MTTHLWEVLAVLLSGPLGYFVGFRKARAQRLAESALARSLGQDPEFQSTLLTYLQLLDEEGARIAASTVRRTVEEKVAERIGSIPASDRILRSLQQDSEIGRVRYLQHLMTGAAWELHHSPLDAVA